MSDGKNETDLGDFKIFNTTCPWCGAPMDELEEEWYGVSGVQDAQIRLRSCGAERIEVCSSCGDQVIVRETLAVSIDLARYKSGSPISRPPYLHLIRGGLHHDGELVDISDLDDGE